MEKLRRKKKLNNGVDREKNGEHTFVLHTGILY